MRDRREMSGDPLAPGVLALRRALLIGALVILLLGVLAMATVRTALGAAEASRAAVAASHQRIAGLEHLLTLLVEAEVGQRGYVIAGDQAFLEPYRAALGGLKRARADLAGLEPREARALAELIDRKLDFIATNIEARRSLGGEVAEAQVRSGRGKRLMDAIRTRIRDAIAAERADLARFERLRAARVERERLTIQAALGGAFLIVLAIGYLLRRELARRRRAEQEASRRSEFLNETLENLDHGVALIDRNGAIIAHNSLLPTLLAATHADGLGIGDREIAAARAGEPLLHERIDHGRSIEVRGRPAPGGSFVITYTDITERRRMETMKNDFVTNVSHELRTPLTSIRASLGLLAGPLRAGLPEQVEQLITIADRNARRLLDLVDDLLDIDKIASGSMSFTIAPVDLAHLAIEAAEANRAYAEARGVAVALGLPRGPVMVKADAGRIQQVMANLLSNAAKFSSAGMTVTISVERLEEQARVIVHDTGAGIPVDFQDQIFEKFAQAHSATSNKTGGSGLGLTIARAIVERHEGELRFRSEPGDTRFWFTLPLAGTGDDG